MGKLKKKFRQVKKLPNWVYFLPALILKSYKVFLRNSIQDPNDHIHREDPVVTVTWHNRLMFFPVMFPAPTRKRTLAVVSPSRDGQYLVDLIARFGIKSLRGSSSKRAGAVLRESIKAIKDNYHVSFTPDGPRGPKYKMSRGPIHLASVTGVPVVPISVNTSAYWQLRSWDNFQIAKPWAKITLVLGDEIKIPPDLDDEGIEKWRLIVEDSLMAITEDKKIEND
jgi:lysophospholipid acyltransferase (LPLAT)-like uncharacterized protein